MNKISVLSLALSILLFSCSQEKKSEQHDHSHDGHSHSEKDHKHSHENYEVLLPEEGGKWEANKETTEGINNMKQLVQDFEKGKSSPEYETLAEELENEFSMIFSRCTMTGEAHEQLHNYLLPMKYMMEGLKSNEEELQKEKLAEIKDHLNEYPKYFQ